MWITRGDLDHMVIKEERSARLHASFQLTPTNQSIIDGVTEILSNTRHVHPLCLPSSNLIKLKHQTRRLGRKLANIKLMFNKMSLAVFFPPKRRK